MPPPPFLLVDPVATRAAQAVATLRGVGFQAHVVDLPGLRRVAETGAYSGVLLAIEIGHNVALRVLGELGECAPELPVVILAEAARAGDASELVRRGAADLLRVPLDADEARFVLAKAAELGQHLADAPPASIAATPLTGIIGTSRAMVELGATIARVASGIATVLVRGESGSGKELVARRLHELSPRRTGPLVKVHCAALPDNLLESELFGYERGAFTGATSRKAGRVELAQGGTLFLDEIGDITPAVQVKLLRVLQDREYERLGGTETLRADVRFVTATHRDLAQAVQAGTFRQDLFYRLEVVTLRVPSLRERPGDIPDLARHFGVLLGRANGRGDVRIDDDALALLAAQAWPGNVRQLQNFVERLIVLGQGPRVSRDDVQRELGASAGPIGFAASQNLLEAPKAESDVIKLDEALSRAERRAIEKALDKSAGNRDVAARLLGISRRSLYYKLQEHGIG